MKLKKLLEHTLGELPSDSLMKMKWNPVTQKAPVQEDKVNEVTVLEMLNKKLKELGFNKPMKKLPRKGGPVTLDKGKIDPKKLGIFGLGFTEIQYELNTYFNEDDKDQYIRIVLSLSYKHPGGGSNGITTTWRWDTYNTNWRYG
jgi:hypothetical protein